MNEEKAASKPDLAGRPEIEILVNTFYDRVRADEVLGHIFDKVAQTNWSTHLPKMYAFWETVLFRSGGFTGNPLAAHAKLVPLTDMGRDKFDHWLLLFRSTVDDLFAGEHAEQRKDFDDLNGPIEGRSGFGSRRIHEIEVECSNAISPDNGPDYLD